TLTTTVDATNLVNLRRQFQESSRHAPRAVAGSTSAPATELIPSYTDLFVKLVGRALEHYPFLNARWHNNQIVTMKEIHIGIAVDTDAGLLVPVVRNVPNLTLRQLAAHTHELADKARQRKISAEDMQGGTFTVTNLGAYGIDAFTPIINWP